MEKIWGTEIFHFMLTLKLRDLHLFVCWGENPGLACNRQVLYNWDLSSAQYFLQFLNIIICIWHVLEHVEYSNVLILHMYVYVVVSVTTIFFTSNNYFFAFGTFKIFSTSYLEIHWVWWHWTAIPTPGTHRAWREGEGGRQGERSFTLQPDRTF